MWFKCITVLLLSIALVFGYEFLDSGKSFLRGHRSDKDFGDDASTHYKPYLLYGGLGNHSPSFKKRYSGYLMGYE